MFSLKIRTWGRKVHTLVVKGHDVQIAKEDALTYHGLIPQSRLHLCHEPLKKLLTLLDFSVRVGYP